MEPTSETVQTLRDICTEIGAGMVLFPKSEAEHAHNNACKRATDIIGNYMRGDGLFQLTRRTIKAIPRECDDGDKEQAAHDQTP